MLHATSQLHPLAERNGPRQTDALEFHELSTQRSGGLAGCFTNVPVRQGVWASIFDAAPDEDLTFHFKKSARIFDFGFFVNGEIQNTLMGRCSRNNEKTIKAGQCGTGILPECKGTVEVRGGTQTRFLHIHMDMKVLRELLQDDMDFVPKSIRNVMEGKSPSGFIRRDTMDPLVLSSVRHLACELQTNTPWRMYLEGKVLELAALQIYRLKALESGPGAGPALSPSERESIRAAGEALVQDLAAPPDLADLAGQFHMSVNKLQHGFRETFGSTVFGFLKEHKMQHAKLLFDQAEMNVSEVAWEVGYINLSHFSAAFKKRFGVLPKQYLKSARSRKSFLAAG